jgi:hypothetical protein
MATRIFGDSGDLIEAEGDVSGEVGFYRHEEDAPCLLICSDGSLLEVKYGKPMGGIWEIKVVVRGSLLQSIEICTDEDADPYSDVAVFADGLQWVIAATDWQRVE